MFVDGLTTDRQTLASATTFRLACTPQSGSCVCGFQPVFKVGDAYGGDPMTSFRAHARCVQL
ncbi:unnamed protein product [Ectocarpus sp. CCAP 1310/34]|nr:unnamed protein product [Ectocarpus sp. CCAP 1310/34]